MPEEPQSNATNNPTDEPSQQVATGSSLTSPITQVYNTLSAQNPTYEYLYYDNNLIEIAPSKINLISLTITGVYKRKIVADFSLKLLSKTIDYKKDNTTYYTFEANNNKFYNYKIVDFLELYTGKIYKGTLGRDIVKFIFNNKSSSIPEKKAKHTCGFKNGWYMPFIKDTDYSIMWDTDEQHSVLKRCMKIYKKYTPEQKKKIIKTLKELINITQIPKEYLSIIIGYCTIAPFKLYFIRKKGLFPHLILSGVNTAGKTAVGDVFAVDGYGHYKNHLTNPTLARFEDMISTSTLLIMIDEFKNIPKKIINTLKEMATSTSPYKRKLSALKQIEKQMVAPLLITSNELGDNFTDPANSSRAIVLEFDKPLKPNQQWIKSSELLRKYKRFSLLYDHTEDWTNKDLDKLMKKIEDDLNLDDVIKRIEKADKNLKNIDLKYPRIRTIYQIIVAGLYLLREMTEIKLPIMNVFETLLQSRRNISEDLLSQFREFCNILMTFAEGSNPLYITAELYFNDKDEFYFIQINLRDFNQFLQYLKSDRSNYKLKNLTELLSEGLTDKTLIKYASRRVNGIMRKVIVIKKKFIYDPFYQYPSKNR